MTVLYTNDAIGHLAVAIDEDDTTLTLLAGDGERFPAIINAGDWFAGTILNAGAVSEIVKVTARSGDVLTVERHSEGTTPLAWAANSRLELRLTAGVMNECVQISDVQANELDATPDKVMLTGAFGLGGIAFRANNDWLLALTGNRTGFFGQGGGELDNRYGAYGTGIHLQYGENADTNFTGNLFLDANGNLTVDWVQIEKATGLVINKTQKLYGPLNKPTPAEIGLDASADHMAVNHFFNVKDATYWQGAGPFSSQYADGTAPFSKGYGYSAPADVSSYHPIVKGMIQTDIHGFGTAISFGILTSGTNRFGSAVIHVIGDNGLGGNWIFDPNNGDFIAHGNILLGGGVCTILSDGNILGSVWESTNLVVHIDNKMNAALNSANLNTYNYYVSGVQLGAEASSGSLGYETEWHAPAGCTITGTYVGDSGGSQWWYKQIMNMIAGSWWGVSGLLVGITTDYYKAVIPKSGINELHDLIPFRSKETPPNCVDFMDKNGYLWSEAQKALRGNVFISYDASGVILCIADIAWMLIVENLSVVGLDSLPAGCSIDGTWIFDGQNVYQNIPAAKAAVLEQNEKVYKRLLQDAYQASFILQCAVNTGKATDADKNILSSIESFVVNLANTDLTSIPVVWPPLPVGVKFANF